MKVITGTHTSSKVREEKLRKKKSFSSRVLETKKSRKERFSALVIKGRGERALHSLIEGISARGAQKEGFRILVMCTSLDKEVCQITKERTALESS